MHSYTHKIQNRSSDLWTDALRHGPHPQHAAVLLLINTFYILFSSHTEHCISACHYSVYGVCVKFWCSGENVNHGRTRKAYEQISRVAALQIKINSGRKCDSDHAVICDGTLWQYSRNPHMIFRRVKIIYNPGKILHLFTSLREWLTLSKHTELFSLSAVGFTGACSCACC